jgi:hypothetical protein
MLLTGTILANFTRYLLRCWWLLLGLVPIMADEYSEFVQKWQKECSEQTELCNKWQRQFASLAAKITQLEQATRSGEEVRTARGKLQDAREHLALAMEQFAYACPQKDLERKIPKYTIPYYESGVRSLRKALAAYQSAYDICQAVGGGQREEIANQNPQTKEHAAAPAPKLPDSVTMLRNELTGDYTNWWVRQVRKDCRYILAHLIEPFATTRRQADKKQTKPEGFVEPFAGHTGDSNSTQDDTFSLLIDPFE